MSDLTTTVVIDTDALVRLLAAGHTLMRFAPSTDDPDKVALVAAIERAERALWGTAPPPRREEATGA